MSSGERSDNNPREGLKYIEQIEIFYGADNAVNILDKTNIDNIYFIPSGTSYGRDTFGAIIIENIDEQINSISVIDTNANFVIIQIVTNENENRFYAVEISSKITCINIEETNAKSVTIALYSSEILYCRYLTACLATDFPPHSKSKTHTITNTHAQHFSQSGHYFSRYLPMKKYDSWSISFDFLTNKDKNNILNFFDINNYTPFILQVWTEPIAKYYTDNPLIYESGAYKLNVVASQSQKIPKYQMTTGLYVCTNEKLEFKKSSNDNYPWSLSLTLREVS